MKLAGYRFVQLRDGAVIDPPVPLEDLDISRPLTGGSLSGALDVTWTAETPVCVGAGDRDPVEPFSIDGLGPVLPGASLRGMVRAVLEIATFSHLGRINEHHHFGERDFDAPDKVKGAWLTRESGADGEPQWVLRPARDLKIGEGRRVGHTWRRLPVQRLLDEVSRGDGPNLDPMDWIGLTLEQKCDHLKAARLLGPQNLTALRSNTGDTCQFLPASTGGQQEKGYICCAGPCDAVAGANGKTTETVIGAPVMGDDYRVVVPKEVMDIFFRLHSDPGRETMEPRNNLRFWKIQFGYRPRDPGRHAEPADLELKNDRGEMLLPGIPVFHTGDLKLLGGDDWADATPPFAMEPSRVVRRPYRYSLGEIARRHFPNSPEHIPDSPPSYRLPRLRAGEPYGFDFARAIFGDIDRANTADRRGGEGPLDTAALKGRVAFKWAAHCGGPSEADQEITGVFAQPRPSFHPFYLTNGDKIGSYDCSESRLAGRKRYPRSPETRKPSEGNENERTLTRLRFLPKDTAFRGRMRFHNLHPVELGALLWSLTFGKPGERYWHAIGRAKAYGYGSLSVRVDFAGEPVVRNLSAEHDAIARQPTALEPYLTLFESYMTRKLSALGVDGPFDQVAEIRQLRAMANPGMAEDLREALTFLPLDGDKSEPTYPSVKKDGCAETPLRYPLEP